MLIDNEKFIGLLAENSGIEKEKVEKYLEELIADIKTAFDEDEGYEVDGFGIFSKLGSNILFIPSEELATEINYKYVGMESIELPGGQIEESPSSEEENPIQDILDGGKPEAETEEYEDPFAELFNEAEEHESRSQEKETDDDDIEAAVEEAIENEDLEEDIFDEILEDQEEDVETPSLVDEEIKEASEDAEKQEEISELLEGTEEEPEEKIGPDEWGIDAHKEDDQEDAFSGLIGEDVAESSELVDEDDIFGTEDEIEDLENEEDQQEEIETEEEEEIDFSVLEDNEVEPEIEDFDDDPFAELDEETEEEEFVPVVTNVSSEKKSKEKVEIPDEVESASVTKKDIRSKNPRDRKQGSPVFLYMVLALVVLGGAGYILAYFGVVNIEGITPPKYKAQVAQNTPPVNQPNSTPPQINQAEEEQTPVKTLPEVTAQDSETASTAENPQRQTENNTSTSEPEASTSDQQNPQVSEENDLAPLVADEKAPGNGGIITPVNNQTEAEPYGLTGTATEVGNNGFTIVLYTLSRKAGADAQFEKLSEDGYRAIIKEKPSEQYGVLYRVSIGQFKTLTDAAIAAEKIDSSILGNYIITKI